MEGRKWVWEKEHKEHSRSDLFQDEGGHYGEKVRARREEGKEIEVGVRIWMW